MSDQPQRTDPRGFLVQGISALLRGGLPAFAALIGTGTIGLGLLVIAPAAALLLAFSFGFAWLKWSRLTYTTGPDNIRVEQGLLSRHARAVPYDRIQDVSLEEKLLPRLFGLAEVRFETGAGGKDEISLAYLSLDEAARLRELVRARKAGAAAPLAPSATDVEPAEPPAPVLFAMDNRRVMTFGLFEFSLVIFAVLLGAAQQFEFLLPFEPWDWARWVDFAAAHRDDFAFIEAGGRVAAALAAIGGVLVVAALGVVTGIARTFAREYGFTLERTAKGFRRRRGLFTRTDVVMPVHRVQAARIGTGVIRRRFGWHELHFVSLANDKKDASHAVAPFAKMDEVEPVVREAGFHLPGELTDWHRPSSAHWFDKALFFAVPLGAGAVAAALFGVWPASVALGMLAAVLVVREHYLWRHDRHAFDAEQLFVRRGWLSPRLELADRLKVQSIELVQGPLARRRGYATLNFGIAGGSLSIAGLPIDRARLVAREVLDSAAAVDFSALPR
ncbi:MAG: PH domain-containing protein [Croceibacterium sp.]